MAADRLLWGLLYESRASRPLGTSEVARIVEEAQSRNERMLITGWLTYAADLDGRGGTFTQYIEGPRHAVRRMFYGEGGSVYAGGPGIVHDARHKDVRVIQEGAFGGGPPGCRLYPDSFMNFAETSAVGSAVSGEEPPVHEGDSA